MTESNVARKQVLDALLKMQHRDYSKIVPPFLSSLDHDPDFVARAMVWLFSHSQLRDLQDSAVITLLKSNPDYGLRTAGRALFGLDFYNTKHTDGMKSLPPFRLLRIFNYMRNEVKAGRGGRSGRVMETLMNDYLVFLERRIERFDQVVVLNRQAMKRAYITLHRKPSAYVNDILFKDNPREDSLLWQIKRIAAEPDPIRKAEMVIEFSIPFRIAASLLPKNNPAAMVARINAMSPTEAANSIHEVEASGILNIKEVNDAFTKKVEKATISAASLQHRKSSKAQSADVQAAVAKATEKAIKEAPKLEGRYLILVDKSTSMDVAIKVAIEFVSYIGPRVSDPANLMIVAQDDTARIINHNNDLSFQNINKAMKLIKAVGWTCLGIGLQAALEAGYEPTHVLHLTDGWENRGPRYLAVLHQSGFEINTTILYLEGSQGIDKNFGRTIENAEFKVETFEYAPQGEGDYYIFDQIANVLAGRGKKSLVETILETELPYVVA